MCEGTEDEVCCCGHAGEGEMVAEAGGTEDLGSVMMDESAMGDLL